MTEVNLGIDPGFLWGVEEVGDAWKGVAIFLGDFVEATEIYAEAERTIFLTDKENGSSIWRKGGMDRTSCKVLSEKFSECLELNLGEGVDQA